MMWIVKDGPVHSIPGDILEAPQSLAHDAASTPGLNPRGRLTRRPLSAKDSKAARCIWATLLLKT
ncbi:MAG: hypothetical protein ABI192_09455 [Bradyrhizobium sp.]